MVFITVAAQDWVCTYGLPEANGLRKREGRGHEALGHEGKQKEVYDLEAKFRKGKRNPRQTLKTRQM